MVFAIVQKFTDSINGDIFFYYFLLTASFGYLINGFFVGWSSNFFTFDETDEFYNVSFVFFFYIILQNALIANEANK